jgi:hypothetical protein
MIYFFIKEANPLYHVICILLLRRWPRHATLTT